MKNFLRGAISAVIVAAGLMAVPQAAALTPEEQDQFRTDPVGAVAWQGIKGSMELLTADQGAYMAVSIYAHGDPRMTYPGPYGEMDRCAKSLTSSSPTGALRFLGAAACLLTNPPLKSAVSAQVMP